MRSEAPGVGNVAVGRLGRDAVAEFHVSLFARGGSFRFVPTRSNGQPAFGIYLRQDTGTFVFRHIQVLTVFVDGIARIDVETARQMLEGLPADQAGAIEARFFEDASYEDIARRLRCSEAVVRKRVSRGLATLRERYKDGGP